MFNLNTLFAVALTSIIGLSTAQATELEPIDMADLHAELSQSIEAMQIDINNDVNSILVADNEQQQKTSQVVQAN
ncbi:hypothetical protein H5123_12180 [Shewanella sp. SR43-4]|jgi:hypothetical protein|uniref:Uncharacterized protein n=1 Tax=Shewanella vesiculosa TaxID=518738 RepID=A0ABV0FPT8_9GAMM|nr:MULTISPECIES: hypothetical protein [Shewanella]NCQ44485.1 hypothetical protein [Shewanella frigidimarina]MBB1318384.1 hypothetical protein [Shewanella sp. SR43-4]MBB1322699.1 hypothetical protein [Shewanella sp. SR43-8]MBB1389625.1 hypothetical protein [Shewanella sp. SG44-6]MBB1474401.1 hypothetical protein [Shewanella sp. SG41-3]|tara:strand:+ start:3528 stop:3752 length:225 start_codon:yes stop_codon:yes gene_type:complete